MKSQTLNILQLCPQVPYPLSDGGKVGIFNITKHLAKRGHRVSVLALDRTPDVDAAPFEQYCELIRIPHSNKNSIPAALMNLFSDEPYNISKYESQPYRKALSALLERKKFDVVHADHLHMARYGLTCKEQYNLPVVLREHNIESVIVERFAENARPAIVRFWANAQARRIRAYEGRLATRCDACCAITEDDRKRLEALAPGAKIRVIPAGVAEEFFTSETSARQSPIPGSIAMFGSFDWLPNQDALRWFTKSILPKIVAVQPSAKLFVIGKGVSSDVLSMQSDRLVVRGFVEDLAKELGQYMVTVVPLRIGGGMRLKIVESFAMRIPVVSTTIGCEGIACRDGEHLAVADTEGGFAAHVVRLLNDANGRDRLVENAFRLVQSRYRWEIAAEEFEKVYQEVIHLNSAGRTGEGTA
jgi:glycosyltransferase involved in cell wall biosynthesis